MIAVAFAAIMCPDSSCSTAFVPGLCFSAPKTGLPGFVRFLRCNLRGAGRIQASASFKNSRKDTNPPSSSRVMAMEECMQWRFETYGHWREYAANESAALEDAFKKGETSVSLSLASSSKSVSGSGLCGYVVRLHGADAFTQVQTIAHLLSCRIDFGLESLPAFPNCYGAPASLNYPLIACPLHRKTCFLGIVAV